MNIGLYLNYMKGKKSKSSKKKVNVVEMIVRGKSSHAMIQHQVMAQRFSYQLNYPSDNIHPKPSVTERKNQSTMTQEEKNRFITGIQTLISAGLYGPHVAHHAMTPVNHMMHSMMGPVGTQRFLPWHRVFLFELEEMLQAQDPQSFIPYWDWSVDQGIPQWLQAFTPTVVVNGLPRTVTRSPGQGFPNLPSPQDVNSVLSQTTYTSFTLDLEGGTPSQMHNGVHQWVGGIMNNIEYSPTDPLFWLHHANIDRIWASWQQNHPNEHPNLTMAQALMDPWTFNELDTRDIANFGYVYV